MNVHDDICILYTIYYTNIYNIQYLPIVYGSKEDFEVANVSLDSAIMIQPVIKKTPPVKMQNATLHRTVKQTSLNRHF